MSSHADHRPAFLAISASYFFLFLYYAFFARFSALLYASYGLDAREIGTLSFLAIIVSMFSSSFWGVVSDRTGRRKLVFACCVLLAASCQTFFALTPSFQSHRSRFVYCCFITLLYALSRGNDPGECGQLKGIAMRTLERFERPAAFGALRLWGAVSWGVAHPLLGYLLDVEHGHVEVLFIGNALAAILFVACFSLLLRSKWADEDVHAFEVEARPKASVLGVVKILCARLDMISWLLCAAAIGMGMQHVMQFLFLYMKRRFQATDSLLGLSVTLTVVLEVPIYAFSERLVAQLGPTLLIAIAMGSFVLRVFGYTVVPSAGWMLLLEPLHGVTFSCFTLASVHYLNEYVPMHMISTAQGFMSFVNAAGSASGAILGGWVMDKTNGGVMLFRLDGVIMSIVLAFFLLSQRCKRARLESQSISLHAGL